MPNCMSKMMLLGMSLQDTVLKSTVNPAKAIGHYPEIGTLGVGRGADVAVLELQNGVFAFKDSWEPSGWPEAARMRIDDSGRKAGLRSRRARLSDLERRGRV